MKLKAFILSFLLFAATLPALAQLTTPIRWVASLPATCVTTNKARVLVYKYTATSGLYYCSATNVWTEIAAGGGGGGSVVSLNNTYGNNLATAITTIGATPTTLLVDAPATCSAAHTFPTTLKLEFTNDAKITESGTCTLTFQGVGLKNPELPVAIFSDFEAGDITWTGATSELRPSTITAELWDTGNVSLSDRLDRADKSVADNVQLKIVLYPRTFTGGVNSGVVMRQKREVYFTAGDYLNTSTNNYSLIFINNYTWFHGAPGARLHESVNNMYFINHQDNTAGYEQVRVEDLTFVGNPDAIYNGFGSTVTLGNSKNSWIRRCLFYKTHAYAAYLGAFGSLGNYAENSDISDNVFIGVGTQVAGLINGINCRVARNFFDQRTATGVVSYTVLDIEPNGDANKVENVIIEDNVIDARDPDIPVVSKVLWGILVQGSLSGSLKNIIIRNNHVYAREFGGLTQATGLTVGIQVYGAQELSIHNNYIRSAYQSGGINVSLSEYVTVRDNEIVQSGGFNQDGEDYAIWMEGVASSQIDGNTMLISYPVTPHPVGSSKIFENEVNYVATTVGTAVTTAFGAFRVYPFFVGKTVTFNNTDYTVASWTSGQVLQTSVAVGSYPAKTFDAAADVDPGTDTITLTAHGYNTGAYVRYDVTAGTGIGGLGPVGGNYYLISTGANTFKLALTKANALADTAINLTADGSGTQTIFGVLTTRFSSNTYSGNNASQGITLVATGTSRIISTYDDNTITNVADTNYTALKNSGIIVYATLTAARTVTLPTATTLNGKRICLKDGAGSGAANNLTFDGAGSETIDGAATKAVVTTNYGYSCIKSNGSNWITVP